MADFDVKIALIDEQQLVYTAANTIEYPAKLALDELTRKLLTRFNYWVGQENTPYERQDFELLGRLLYRVLLPESVRKLFEADYGQFCRQTPQDDKNRFRLTLELHEGAGEVAGYPWEFLFIPRPINPEDWQLTSEGGFFLAGAKNKLILTRFVPNVSASVTAKTDEPLRILIAFSHPCELPNIASKLTRDVISQIEGLGQLFPDIEVRLAENPTHTELYELMNGPDEPGEPPRPIVGA